jgi:hypothetical protein
LLKGERNVFLGVFGYNFYSSDDGFYASMGLKVYEVVARNRGEYAQ